MTRSNCSSIVVVHILFARMNWKQRFIAHRLKNPTAESRHDCDTRQASACSGPVRVSAGDQVSTGLAQELKDFP
ncbi:MAG: hypothetical protein AAFW74_16725, partial [Pseudomonadota bacterium]